MVLVHRNFFSMPKLKRQILVANIEQKKKTSLSPVVQNATQLYSKVKFTKKSYEKKALGVILTILVFEEIHRQHLQHFQNYYS